MKKTCYLPLLFSIGALTTAAQAPSVVTDNHGHTITSFRERPGVPEPGNEAGNPWTAVGPFGGDVVSMCIDPQNTSNLYAAAGLPFFSTDGGDHWDVLSTLAYLSSNYVNAFAALTNGTILATGPYTFGKVFRSTNGGTSWHTRNIPVSSNGRCLATDPGDSSTIYVGLATNVSSSVNKVIVRSTDSGDTWTAFDMTSVLPVGWSVIDISVDPDDSQTIFAVANTGISDAKIVASFDGGASWQDRTSNLPTGIPYNAVAIAGQKIFLAGGQLFGGQNLGIYRSDDYGISWTNISASFPNKVTNDILIDPADIDNMFAATEGDGVYYSNDGGITWNFDAGGAGSSGAARCLILNPEDHDQIFAGFLSLALCRSDDAGLTWEFANTGIATLQVDDIEVNPLDEQEVLVAFEAENSGGCHLSLDGGSSWELVTGLPGTRFSQVTFGSDGTMYAWSNGPSTVAQEGLYKSADGGDTWTNLGPNVGSLFETQIFAVTASRNNPDLILIGGNNFGVNGWASVIYRTNDGGQTWVNTYLGPAEDYYSIRFLFIAPNTDDLILYAAYKSEVQGGFLKSTDGGLTWTDIGTTIPVPYKWGGAIVCEADDPDAVVAGCGGYGNPGTVVLSGDGGLTWDETGLHLGNYSKINDLLIHPANADVLYCASSQDGVMLSTDGGSTWLPANDGLPATNINGFSNPFLLESAWHCFAASYTNSAFETTLFDPSTNVPRQTNDEGINIRPNPSAGNFSIAVPENEMATAVEIMTITGKPVYTKHTENKGCCIPIRVNLPDGVYIVKVILKERMVYRQLIIR